MLRLARPAACGSAHFGVQPTILETSPSPLSERTMMSMCSRSGSAAEWPVLPDLPFTIGRCVQPPYLGTCQSRAIKPPTRSRADAVAISGNFLEIW